MKEITEVCSGCKDTHEIKEPLPREGVWRMCRFCGKIRWCLLYLI